MRVHLACLFATTLVACTGGAGDVVKSDAYDFGLPDNTADLMAEVAVEEAKTELPFADAPGDVQPEAIDECPPGAGCFGDPCEDNADCLSGFCVEHLGGKVCTDNCLEECPAGWSCQQLTSGGADVVYLCASNHPALCRPCASDVDCQAGQASADVCAAYDGEGAFCASPCDAEKPCPEGYSCQQAEIAAGDEVEVCVADAGVCDCTELSIKLGLGTPCEVENEFGVCAGERKCSAEGLADCSAAVPSFEVCNGEDDNCDGVVDEGACDDDNPCTADLCDPGVGCGYEPLQATECDDEDLCTLTDHCEDGACEGTPIACNDNNPCTDDGCDGQQGCVFEANNDPCDDGDPCTIGDSCSATECAGVPVDCQCQSDEDCLTYDDGNACNGTLYCDQQSAPWQCKPEPGTAVECEPPTGPGSQCLQAYCNPQNGECSLVPAHEGLACDDGNQCTYGAVCQNGSCAGGLPLNCTDATVCTTDSCSPDQGCIHVDNSSPCDDGNLCTVNDQCDGGLCQSGDAMPCEDGNACTDDSCNPLLGCVHANNAAACDDLDPCTVTDSCSGGLCVGTGAKECDDSNPCTHDVCLPMIGCSYNNNDNPCDDDNECTSSDQCLAGMCVPGAPVECDDQNPCTDDSCNPAEGCHFQTNTLPCDDGNSCTINDKCEGGVCKGTGSVDCDDGNPCTKDLCTPGGGCGHEPTEAVCSDGDACTVGDSCDDGDCLPGAPADCDDGNLCTDDSCAPESGCQHTPNDDQCDDFNLCTENDQCQGGGCHPGEPMACDDEEVCTTDYCDPAVGCIFQTNTAPCNDGNICTTDDHCSLGECLGGGQLACVDGNGCTDDSCSPEAGCQFIPNDLGCDDGNECTTGDHCFNGNCATLGMLDCNDDNLCTTEYCDPAVGCVNEFNSVPCDDGNACTLVDVCAQGACAGEGDPNCDDSNVCTADSCDPDTGCVNTPISGNQCDDDDECTVTDACEDGECVGSGQLDCDDGNVCTLDSCDPDVGCQNLPDNGVQCDDGSVCTVLDLCEEGGCVPGDPLECDDNDPCTTDSCDAVDGCQNVQDGDCCGNGQIDPGEECDDGNNNNGDYCNNNCQFTGSVYNTYQSDGRTVYIFKSDSNAPLSQYNNFCESQGLSWFVPKSQGDAQKLINNAYNLDQYHTWIITKNNTTAGTFGGFSVSVDNAGCVAYSNSGFSAIRKWSCSYCEPENHGHTKCWDGHTYDWLVCQGG